MTNWLPIRQLFHKRKLFTTCVCVCVCVCCRCSLSNLSSFPHFMSTATGVGASLPDRLPLWYESGVHSHTPGGRCCSQDETGHKMYYSLMTVARDEIRKYGVFSKASTRHPHGIWRNGGRGERGREKKRWIHETDVVNWSNDYIRKFSEALRHK